MIPVSVSDIIKLLDEIPIWRSVSALPKRLAALEERVATLEAAKAVASARPPLDPARVCPMCGEEMKVTAETGHPTFHFAGVKVHQMKCQGCGRETSRQYKPGKGYT